MIFGSIHSLDFYLREPFALELKEYLLTLNEESEDGTRDFGKYKVIVSTYATEHSQLIERHREMTDIHMVLLGQETVEYYEHKKNKVKFPYDYEKDVEILYKDSKPTVSIPLLPNNMCILVAGEAHSPGLPLGGSMRVKKVVVKIPIQRPI